MKKKKYFKRLIALLLVVAMVSQYSFDISAATTAVTSSTEAASEVTTEDKKDTATTTEEKKEASSTTEEKKEEQKTEEPKEEEPDAQKKSSEEKPAEEATTEAKKEETTEQKEEEKTEVKEETSTEQESAKEVEETAGEVPAEATTEQKEEYPAFTATVTEKDVEVTVTAEAGVLPAGVTLSVKKLEQDGKEYKEAEKALSETEYDGMLAYDISFLDKDGNEIEPKGEVKVSMSLKADALSENVKDVTIQHLDETGEDIKVETVANEKVTKDGVDAEFTVDSFSTFTIVWKDGTIDSNTSETVQPTKNDIFTHTGYLYRSPHRYDPGNGSNYIPAIYTLTYKDANQNDQTVYGYCCDLVTSVEINTSYKRLNLEDAGYYSPDNAKKIRSILNEGFWNTRASSSELNTLAVKAGITDGSLTIAEALSATQNAIWFYANNGGAKNIYTCTKNVVEPGTIDLNLGNQYTNGAVDSKASSNISKVYDYLTGLKGTEAPQDSIVYTLTGVNATKTLKDEKKGLYDVQVNFNILGNINANNTKELSLTLTLDDGTNATAHVDKKDDGYTVTFTDVKFALGSSREVTLSLNGKQQLPDGVYFYMPNDRVNADGSVTPGREVAQSFVGFSQGGVIPIHASAKTKLTREVTVKKVWDDSNNQDGVRPNSVIVKLFENGKETGKTVTLSAENNWKATFEELNPLSTYTVAEVPVEKYIGVHVKENEDLFTIKNRHEPEKISISGSKTWEGDSEENRPESIKVFLYADGSKEPVKEQTVTASNNWKYEFKNLDKYKDGGQEIVYTISEEPVPGYASTVSGYNITNTALSVKVNKVDGEGKPVVGAKLVIKDENGKVITNEDGKPKYSYTTDGKEIHITQIPAGNYILSEVEAPEGYYRSEDVTFTVKDGSEKDAEGKPITVTIVTMTDEKIPEDGMITVSKVWDDSDNQDGIRPDSITVELYENGTDTAVDEAALSKENGWTATFKNLKPWMTYTVKEKTTVNGYTSTVTPTTVTPSENEAIITVTNKHEAEKTTVSGSKTWVDDTETDRPESITVSLYANGSFARKQTVTQADNWNWTFEGLDKYKDGKEIQYTISEDSLPGYVTTVNGLNLTNKKFTVKINKVDITGEQEVTGATLQVTDESGEVIDTWISDDKGAHDISKKLIAGGTYTLTEIKAPEGYRYSESIQFTVGTDGKVLVNNEEVENGIILMKDDVTHLTIKKIGTDGKPVVGAKLVIKDKDGNVIKTKAVSGKNDGTETNVDYRVYDATDTGEPYFITTGKPIQIDKLPAKDDEYILSEIEAPAGYKVAEDKSFPVSDKVNADNTVTMTDAKEETTQGKITVTKTMSVADKPIGIDDDVENVTFYVALFSDEAKTQRVSNVKALVFDKQHSTSTTVVFENLNLDTYYIGETDEYGNVIDDLEGDLFEPQYIDGDKVEITPNALEAQKLINNRFDELPDDYYYVGTLNITKKVLKGTKAWNTDNVYYAGIFTDPEYTQLLVDPIALRMNGESETTEKVQVSLGTDENATTTYYVTETDANGVPLENSADLAFTVSVDGSVVELSTADSQKTVTITNTYEEDEEEESDDDIDDREGYSYNDDDSDSETKTTKSSKTGDESRVGTYTLLLLCAGAIMILTFWKRKKRA